MKENSKFIVIAVGGSLIVPHLSADGGIDLQFVEKFRQTIFQEVAKGKKFVIIVGGGKIARTYQQAISQIPGSTADDLDWVGIYSTRLNARLLLSVFKKEAHIDMIDHDLSEGEMRNFLKSKKKLYIGAGWKPGWSTDYIAMKLAEKFGAKEMIDAGDIDFVYDKDPKKFPDVKPIPKLSWSEYRKLIPTEWAPGMSCPIDPIAARLAQRSGITAKTLKGTDLLNLKNAIEGKEFSGTLIS